MKEARQLVVILAVGFFALLAITIARDTPEPKPVRASAIEVQCYVIAKDANAQWSGGDALTGKMQLVGKKHDSTTFEFQNGVAGPNTDHYEISCWK